MTSTQMMTFLRHTSGLVVVFLVVIATLEIDLVASGDMMRKSIVFDKNTPDVFYCPQDKPAGYDKMLVRAKPLLKLCEFNGQPLPDDYKPDCYNDVDESEFACSEKKRIMTRLNPPSDINAIHK